MGHDGNNDLRFDARRHGELANRGATDECLSPPALPLGSLCGAQEERGSRGRHGEQGENQFSASAWGHVEAPLRWHALDGERVLPIGTYRNRRSHLEGVKLDAKP